MKNLIYLIKNPMSRLLCLLLLALFAQVGHAQMVTISGTILTPEGMQTNDEYLVQAFTTDTVYETTFTGSTYSLQVPSGAAYVVRPCGSSKYPLNGVSTYDLVLMARHYHSLQALDSPYKIIAADLDRNSMLNEADSLIGRNLILGVSIDFPDSIYHRFVPAAYQFPNLSNPFQPPFPEYITTGILSADYTDADFIVMRLGDLNNSAVLSGDTDPKCLPSPYAIVGRVKVDVNTDCTAEASEPGIANRIVVAENGNGGTFYGYTLPDGAYTLSAPPGTYTVSLQLPNSLWAVCTPSVSGVMASLSGQSIVDFSIQALAECPAMTVDLSTFNLRRCFPTNHYTVRYCNEGTIAAQNAYVDVTFDPAFEIMGSSIPWSDVNGYTYRFPVGDVDAGECGQFVVDFTVSCEAALGQTHCTQAHIYPDTVCTALPLLWNGANLEVSGECMGDSVRFIITNTGLDMTDPVEYVVIEDIIIQMHNSDLLLAAGQSRTITLPANGSTWRVEVDQAPFHPFQQLVSAALEGCGENQNGTFSLGYVTQFAQNSGTPYEDEDCRENTGSYDPNDKQGFPKGVQSEHFIPMGQEIEYLIRFQNTGTDTAFHVRIQDTLSQFLDPATVRPLGGSHPYFTDLNGAGVLQFTFPNIMLPDSNVNEAASHGYVKFAVRPRSDVQSGTIVNNSASIYFDLNDSVLTNETAHTYGEQYLRIWQLNLFPSYTLSVFPNPTSGLVNFRFEKAPDSAYSLQVFNSLGQLQLEESLTGTQFALDASGLPPGLYHFRIHDGLQMLATGKLEVQR